MWCCVGTGMENHSKYGHFIYTHQGDSVLYVNLFTASKLEDETFALTQSTQFPEEQGTTITINKAGSYTLAIRRPSWVDAGFSVSLNNKEQNVAATKRISYFRLKADFKAGDEIRVKLPMSLRYEVCPNLTDYVAFKYGPLLLAARTTSVSQNDQSGLPYEALSHEYALGERMGHAPDSYAPKLSLGTMPMLIGNRSEVLKRIQPTDNKLEFTLDASRNDATSANYTWSKLTLVPFYQLHHSRVNVYWYQQTYENYTQSTWAQAEAEAQKLEERTLDRVDVGQQQAEAGAVTYSYDSSNGTYNGEDYRDTKANGWIQVVLNNPDPDAKNLGLVLRYTTADKDRRCSIYVNGTMLKEYTVPASSLMADGNGFFNVEFPLGELAMFIDGHALSVFTVRIVASGSTMNPGLYYIRLTRDYQPSQFAYQFKAADWAYTGDTGRVQQSKILADEATNSISLTQSGTNNICLKYGSAAEYEIPYDQKYLVIRGSNLSKASGYSYLWWLNGANAGTQVAPTAVSSLEDQRTQLVWDITKSGLTKNCSTDPWILSTSYHANSTLFGLTAQVSSQPVVISYIGFLNEAQLNGKEKEPEGDLAVGEVSVAPDADSHYYFLDGLRSDRIQPGSVMVHQGQKLLQK